MIVIGLDVHKQSVTAVAVDEAGRPLEERVIPVGSCEPNVSSSTSSVTGTDSSSARLRSPLLPPPPPTSDALIRCVLTAAIARWREPT
jgi:hypothetical protein